MLDKVLAKLAEASDLSEVKDIRDQAQAIRQYAASVKASLLLQNKAAELKLRAERRAGEMLCAMGLRGGDHMTSADASRLTLEELGISHNQSTRWQKEAVIPEQEFCEFVAVAQKEGHELTSASLLRFAAIRQARTAEKRNSSMFDEDACETDEPPHAVRTPSHPRAIIAEISDHCQTLYGMLSPLYDGSGPTEIRPCIGKAVQRMFREIRSLLGELERCTTNEGDA